MARLRRAAPGVDAGITRTATARGFRYVAADGRAVTADDLARIRALAIPPAWENVWICADPRGHVQAVGTDAAGRRQYLYHPDWGPRRDRLKFARALELAGALPRARASVTRALRDPEPSRERTLAASFRILDSGALRVGSERYLARGGGRGLTTLVRRDVTVEGERIVLGFTGKSGVAARVEFADSDLAPVLAELAVGSPRGRLLTYPLGRRRVALSSAEVNEYVRRVTGVQATAKDFRTLRGTAAAAAELARAGDAATEHDRRRARRDAVDACARVLGNTPAVARGSYIDPRVWQRYEEGRILDLTVSPERALRELLIGSG